MSGAPQLRIAVRGPNDLLRRLIERLLREEGLEAGGEASVHFVIDPDSGDLRPDGAPVIVVTSRVLSDAEILGLLTRGANAVLHADSAPAELAEAGRFVGAGGVHLAPEQAKLVVLALREGETARQSAVELTAREYDILASIVRGESVKQTSRALGISAKTVENLQSRLFRKLGARNRAQAVAHAFSRGVIDLTGETASRNPPAAVRGAVPMSEGCRRP